MRRTAFFTMAVLASAAVFGQGLLDCMEPDVLHLLQGMDVRPLAVTGAVPAELSALKMPRDFTWIGTAERVIGRVDATTDATQVTAAWRSGLAPTAVRTAVAEALAASGWEVREPPGRNINVLDTGFQIPTTGCRDGKPVNVSANRMDGVTYVLFTLQRGNNNNSICNQPVLLQGSVTGFDQYLPHLEMPVDPPTGPGTLAHGGSSWGGSTSAFSARTQFISRDSIGNLGRYFARQMVEQGWSSDANWSGAATAGSSWSRRIDSGLIEGTLSLTSLEDRQFMIVLRVTRMQ